MSKLSYSLREIASWATDDGSAEVTIPALQRGLVWKPNQVELLWDSILRGFPIGSFLLSDIVGDNENNKNGKYYLMDGQQRYNAISIGYKNVFNSDDNEDDDNNDIKSILWIDLAPIEQKDSTRVFWIKITTTSHPWGFKHDDKCTRFDTAERREALEVLGLEGKNIFRDKFSLKETWPTEANRPIPLCWLLNSKAENPNDFYEDICNKFEEFKNSARLCKHKEINLSDYISGKSDYIKNGLFPAFQALNEYRVNCNFLSEKVIKAETDNGNNEKTTLETLFTRLNTGGTPISKDDLNYSAIKAYWPEIKDTNDELAKEYMHPSKLAMLAFRLALTIANDRTGKGSEMENELSIKKIRSLAGNEEIRDLYDNYLEKVLKKIDEWLGVVSEKGNDKTPSILRTTIARNSPDVYLLLMYFAYKDLSKSIKLPPSGMKALAFCLHWFSEDKKACVQEIFRRNKDSIDLENIRKGISRLIHDHKLLPIYTPSEVKGFIKIIKGDKDWKLWNEVPVPAKGFFNRVFWYGSTEAKEMLLYAEREYINTKFPNYDPARQDLWEDYNRPWDFDHIVAQNRINGKRGEYREYDKGWLYSIGNMAAISYEANRSKSDSDGYDEYRKNANSLMYSKKYAEEIEKMNPNKNITEDKEMSITFASITYSRFNDIYERAYGAIEVLFKSVVLSETLQERKNLFTRIKEEIPEAEFFFVASGEDYKLEREQDWTREWIGVGQVIDNFMVCFEWVASKSKKDNKPLDAEIGIRRALGTKVTAEDMAKLSLLEQKKLDNEWWYKCESWEEELNKKAIGDKLKQLKKDHLAALIQNDNII